MSNKKTGLKLENIHFNYYNNGQKIVCLKEINLEKLKNNLFIIGGERGSGKSNLLSLISGLLVPESGYIKFNQTNRNNNAPKISFLNQDYALINATIAENVAFGIPKSKINIKHLNNCLKKAGIHEYINSLRDGFNYILGDKGEGFSIGQKQRLSIARALYFNLIFCF